jgi:hypothetical protein
LPKVICREELSPQNRLTGVCDHHIIDTASSSSFCSVLSTTVQVVATVEDDVLAPQHPNIFLPSPFATRTSRRAALKLFMNICTLGWMECQTGRTSSVKQSNTAGKHYPVSKADIQLHYEGYSAKRTLFLSKRPRIFGAKTPNRPATTQNAGTQATQAANHQPHSLHFLPAYTRTEWQHLAP